jgi:hypothetical protein
VAADAPGLVEHLHPSGRDGRARCEGCGA